MSNTSNSDGWRLYPSAMVKPLTGTVARRLGSVRRTSHIDMQVTSDSLVLVGAARDLHTPTDPTAVGEVLAAATVAATASATRVLQQLDITPHRPAADALIGRVVGPGFRDALARCLPAEMAASTPLALLLDDLPVAALISGYTYLYGDSLPQHTDGPAVKADICSGWRSDGTMLVAFREKGAIPTPVGPPTTPLESPDDPLGWHPIGELGLGAMRRRRLVDVSPGDTADELWVQAMFRDTYVGFDGVETVLHEYTLTAVAAADTLVIRSCDAIPRVLPWVECPVAAASAWKLVGHPTTQVRSLVRTDLRGTSTCTHLNDLLRSLGDVGVLAAELR
ncbi:MAG: DUF2889 domain-containing protein [Actinomycetota bacterium]|nr:DUF2889 domain-containing protein [Actinomycetota bacterium]